MKKAAVLVLSLVFLSFLYITNDNKRLFETKSFIGSYPLFNSESGIYEDLYHFAFLKEFKIRQTEYSSVPLQPPNFIKQVNLYYLGDSYIYLYLKGNKLKESQFKSIHESDWKQQVHSKLNIEKLDTSEVNILVLERTERFMKDLSDKYYVYDMIIPNIGPSKKETLSQKLSFNEKMAVRIDHVNWMIATYLYNTNKEYNLYILLFGYKFANRVKELKASLNYHLFNRIDKDVCMSTDKKYLFIEESVDSTNKLSSFYPVSDTEVDSLALSLKEISSTYKKAGFDEVYFSFPPNPVSIMEPERGKYNYIIPRLHKYASSDLQIVDIYTPFKNTRQQVYYNADTHWNYTGFNMWLNELYKKVDTLAATSPRVKNKLQRGH